MAKINSFEDIKAWQKSIELVSSVYKLTLRSEFSKDFALKDQIRKSAISIPSNIAEGFERGTNNQFIYFLSVAKASSGELRTQILIAHNLNYLNTSEYETLYNENVEVSKMISGLITYLKQHKN